MLVGPTGVAAFDIVGLTIHYAFRLPVEHGNLTRYTKLSAERLHQLRLLCKDVHTIIIDEYGLIRDIRVHPPTTHRNQRY